MRKPPPARVGYSSPFGANGICHRPENAASIKSTCRWCENGPSSSKSCLSDLVRRSHSRQNFNLKSDADCFAYGADALSLPVQPHHRTEGVMQETQRNRSRDANEQPDASRDPRVQVTLARNRQRNPTRTRTTHATLRSNGRIDMAERVKSKRTRRRRRTRRERPVQEGPPRLLAQGSRQRTTYA